MMDERIISELEQEHQTDFHRAMLEHVKGLVSLSQDVMSARYPSWDDAKDIYRGVRYEDKSDEAAGERGEPKKMVVPIGFAQVQTFVSFNLALFTQRERIFELVGKGPEDHQAAKVGEGLIARDLQYNVFESRLYQFLLDIARFGLGVLRVGWVEKQEKKQVEEEVPGVTLMGMQLTGPSTQTVEKMVTTYQGNEIRNVSPYKFFPDTRLPVCRFQEGEFCASEYDYSLAALHQMEAEGVVAGIKWVKPISMIDGVGNPTWARRYGHLLPDPTVAAKEGQTAGMALLTEVVVRIIPSKFQVNGEPLGPETVPTLYTVWYVNDDRIVKFEPFGYAHGQFPYSVGEYSPDMHEVTNAGLNETIDQIQSVISWFINSHITSVRKTIQNFFVVDPAGIEVKDFVERKPVIRLKPDKANQGVDRFIKQMEVRDVTASHIGDAMQMHNIAQIVTGINDNALGQFHTGRRSAAEARNVNAGTAARLKTHALLIFRSALEPMARQMLSNLQDGLTAETYVRVLGEQADPNAYQSFVKVTKDDLHGDYDFEVFDGTLPSERNVQAQTVGEFIIQLLGNPNSIPLLGYDPRKLTDEWLELRGIRNPKRFLMDQARQAELTAIARIQNGGPIIPEGEGTAQGGQPGPVAGPSPGAIQ